MLYLRRFLTMLMEATKYIWMNGKFLPWQKATCHVLTHALHYGSAAFEGIRCYETKKGPAIFRLKDHTKRLFYSAKALRMKVPYSQKQINLATIKTIRKNQLKHCYIRPMLYYGYGKMGLNPAGVPVEAIIACWPWGTYLSEDPIAVKTSSFIRIHPKSSVTDAKISGHYVNSIMAVQEISGSKYQEALLLDYQGNIAEGPGENFFLVKKKTIYTPPLGTVLKGITRATVMEIAEYLGYKVVEKKMKLKDAYSADEAFFTGTAAEVTSIGSIDDKKLNKGKMGPVTAHIREIYMDTVSGRNKHFEKYLSYV